MRVPCASQIDRNCEGFIKLQAYDESQEPVICSVCQKHLEDLHIKKENKK
ncbi:MAG: hypothetical protein PHY02_10825 [Phycisphaerae bacterium]|nr:hypothetical protein [Phycisphaerae bacterium]